MAGRTEQRESAPGAATGGSAPANLPGRDAPIRVCLLISGLMYGGGQRVVLDLLRQVRAEGDFDPRLVLLGCDRDELRSAADSVIPYDGRYSRPAVLWHAARRLRTVLRHMAPDIIHSHGWDADIIGWRSRRGTRTRQIIHLHITPEWLGSQAVKHRIRRVVTRRAYGSPGARLAAVSGAVREFWSGRLPWNGDTIRVIRNGIDVRKYGVATGERERGRAVPVIGIAARLAPMKGIEFLLVALATLAGEGREFRCLIAGTGSSREQLEARARDLGLGERVTFLGQVEEMPAFYRGLDIFVLPSVSTEGLPLGVLEAMAAGLPIVATTVAGTPEAVSDGREGLLVPPRDSGALAVALRRLVTDRELRHRLGDAARKRAREEFSLERFAGAMAQFYRETAGGTAF